MPWQSDEVEMAWSGLSLELRISNSIIFPPSIGAATYHLMADQLSMEDWQVGKIDCWSTLEKHGSPFDLDPS